MKILYIGDIMGSPGRHIVERVVPKLRKTHDIDVVIAQAENVSHGKSMSPHHMRELQRYGIDFFTGGNHTPERADLHNLLANPAEPVISPANLEAHPESWGIKELATSSGKILVLSLLGQTFPKSPPMRNPLRSLDAILEKHPLMNYAAIIANFHADFSSEKRVIGYYSDGRVTAMVGDHWHVPTADAMVLPKGTAHITDVGMCGTLHSSLGVDLEMITRRWRDAVTTPNRIVEDAPFQFNAVLITTDPDTHLATKIEPINKIIENIR
ncbi:MAG TPA: TIGR00282 family metallophosphoesterase [Candidatus Saccharimonadales bacterium]|nr:TIGR00282 family metallophosphoesterase [Candidatus Saccharimonadales bacterium]